MKNLSKMLLGWLFSLERREKVAIQVFFDSLLIPIVFLLAFYMRLENTDFLFEKDTYIAAFIAALTALGACTCRGFYNSFVRQTSLDEVLTVLVGSFLSCAVVLAGTLLLELQIPRSVPIIYFINLPVFLLGIRFFIRATARRILAGNREKVAVYGAGAAGIQLMEALRQNPHYFVSLFIDDNPELDGKRIAGIPIYNLDHAKKRLETQEIKTLLLAIPSNIHATRQRVLNLLPDYPLRVKTMPTISSLIKGKTDLTDLRDINVEDLLGREPVQHDASLMAKTIVGKSVLVTGAGGSIGGELCRQIIEWEPAQLIMLDVSEAATYTVFQELKSIAHNRPVEIIPLIGSVQDKNFLKKLFSKFEIDTVFHAAAYKHVPLMEQNIMECIANNVFGTLNIVELSIAAKIKNFTLISTDKAVRPTNYMGVSKRFAEIICQTFSAQQTTTFFATVRFGNVLGSSGSVVPLFKKQIDDGGPITLTHPDMTRYFMTIPEAAQLVIQAGSIARRGQLFVLDMGNPIRILDLAKKMAALSGLKPILNSSAPVAVGEINISITGLRPGEKLFEELSYSGDLYETEHPRIMKTFETAMPLHTLQELLDKMKIALQDFNHHSLHKIIAEFSGGVPDIESSKDNFIIQYKKCLTTKLNINANEEINSLQVAETKRKDL